MSSRTARVFDVDRPAISLLSKQIASIRAAVLPNFVRGLVATKTDLLR